MKKLLFGILTFLGIGLSFCSAYDMNLGEFFCTDTPIYDSSNYVEFNLQASPDSYSYFFYLLYDNQPSFYSSYRVFSPSSDSNYSNFYIMEGQSFCAGYFLIGSGGTCGNSSSSNIDVYYNNGNSVETITCDGTQAIDIRGLSTITSTNTFTPYYNISYIDEDNQKLIESYSKDILYLENGQFKKTYTGNNDWILTYQGSLDSTFTGYVPVFDVSGSTQPIDTDYNMFNNFTDNSLKVLLSNIPGYIQYVFIIGIILLLLGIVKMFKRRK